MTDTQTPDMAVEANRPMTQEELEKLLATKVVTEDAKEPEAAAPIQL